MKHKLVNLYRSIIPLSIRFHIGRLTYRHYLRNLRRKILNYYKDLPKSEEVNDVINYLRSNPITIFPYQFSKKYMNETYEIYKDPINRLYYVLMNGKKLYFKRGWTKEKVQNYYRSLRTDQDKESPHRYLNGEFNVSSKDIVADVGSAEGNFSLSIIQDVKFIYLFEMDEGWIEALKETFKPWKGKVKIVNKKVGNKSGDGEVRLDDFFDSKREISFLKADIEGYELEMLDGAQSILSQMSPLKIVICTYHRQEDEKLFGDILEKMGYAVKASNGYMIFYNHRNLEPPYLRRGLIRASKP